MQFGRHPVDRHSFQQEYNRSNPHPAHEQLLRNHSKATLHNSLTGRYQEDRSVTPSLSMDEFVLHNGSGVDSLNHSDPHYSLHPHQNTAVAASQKNNQYGDGFERGNHYNTSNTAYESHSGSSTNQQYRRSLAEGINGDGGDQQYRGIQTNSNDDEGNENSTINTSKTSVFVQESFNNSGEIQWSCRHCNCMPYSFRAPGSIFKGPDPPSFAFIEQHLSVCRGNMRYYHGDESVSGNDPDDKNKLDSSTGSNPNSGYGYGGNIYPQCHQVSHMYSGMNPVYGQHHGYSYIHPPQAGGVAGYSSDGYFKGNRNDLQNDMISPHPSGQGYPHHPVSCSKLLFCISSLFVFLLVTDNNFHVPLE